MKLLVRINILFTLASLTLSVSAAKVYFVNDQQWSAVKAYMWTGGSNNSWPGATMTKETGLSCSKGDVYSIEAGSYQNIIFNNGSGTQTGDLKLNATKPYWYQETAYTSLSEIEKGGGTYVPEDYASAVPGECPDIMLQGFYWDSYDDKGYGNTKWTTLENQAAEIGSYFSLIWLPPSSMSDGGLGYHPKQYSNQNSNSLGNQSQLKNMMAAMHDNDVRVIADIVINHAGNQSSWCNFYTNYFGSYGTFSPDGSWITKNDEVSTSESGSCKTCSANSNLDDGYGNDANYGAARDWDHKNTNVQQMCRAYLQWMKNVMLYDGFRFDYCKGFNTAHVNDYVSAAKPYLSVMEYWDGNVSILKSRIDNASKNTMAFDFAAKYNVFRDGIYKKSYGKLKTEGLRGQGYQKYAVTFIDNHDTFNRGNSGDVAEKGDGSSINNQELMLQCNAYLLSMPGVPCVFYPHWVKYKAELKEMIKARWIAGVHSESKVQDESSGSGYYKATIVGKTGSIKLMIGANSGYATTPSGYIKAYAGNNCGVYYQGTGQWPRQKIITDLEIAEPTVLIQKSEKLLINNRLYIRYNDELYDMLGNKISVNY